MLADEADVTIEGAIDLTSGMELRRRAISIEILGDRRGVEIAEAEHIFEERRVASGEHGLGQIRRLQESDMPQLRIG